MERLALTIERQGVMTRWCWAAVTAGVWNFYRRPHALTMCEVATIVRIEPCCPPGVERCHDEAALDRALHKLRLLSEPTLVGAIPLRASGAGPSIESEIAAGRPVGVGLRFDTFAHFCVVHGCDAAGGRVAVADSLFDNALSIQYGELRDAYRNAARWVATYLTHHPGPGAP